MIIIGYQGIGKSSLTEKVLKRITNGNLDGPSAVYVDLESSNRYAEDGNYPEDWYKFYCKTALHLSNIGFTVFTSCHPVVREYFKEITHGDHPCIHVCYPSHDLKEAWIDKLRERYNVSKLEKDLRAYSYARDNYDENIRVLEESGFNKIVITDIDYDLESVIRSAKLKFKREMKLFSPGE